MKTKNIFGMIFLAAAFAACSQEDITTGNNEKSPASADVDGVTLNISDQLFANVEGGSRAADDAEANTTTFESGDQIGLYTVLSGTVVKSNLKYTFNGTNWVDDSGKATIVAAPGTVFVAYYPYSATAPTVDASDVAALTVSSEATALKNGAEGFYADKIANWTPAADQSTKALYTAQDLMVAAAVPDAGATSINLVMNHEMAMHELWFDQQVSEETFKDTDAPLYKYNIDDYGFYNIADGKYRRITKPSTTIGYQGVILDVLDGEEQGGWYTNTAEGSIAAGKMRVFKYSTGSASLTTVPSPYKNITAGSIIYTDGTWSTTYNNTKTPAAIVFSTSTSANDKKLGYKHGYAIALYDIHTDGNYSVRYSDPTNGDDEKISKGKWALGTYESNQATDILHPQNAASATTVASWLTELSGDLDGLTHQRTAISKLGAEPTASDLRAIYLAKNYGVTRPAYTSEWYLPSIGQQYLWCTYFANSSALTAASATFYPSASDRQTIYWSGDMAKTIGTAMNSWFTSKISDTSKWDAWDANKKGKFYWSSTERVASRAFSLYFNTNGDLTLPGTNAKSSTDRRVRAVFAF